MMFKVLFAVIASLVAAKAFVIKAQLPSYLQRCSKSDPDLNACFVRNGNKAIPRIAYGEARYGIPNMVPYKLDQMVLRDDNTLRFILRNVQIYGLEKARLKEINLDFERAHLTQNLTIPRLTILGDYELDGTIVDEQVQGIGRANITIGNSLYTTNMRFKTENSRAVPLKPYTYYKPQLMIFNLNNMYRGNQFRSYQTNIYLNNNWRQVNKAIEEGTAYYVNELITKIYKTYASLVTIDELYLD